MLIKLFNVKELTKEIKCHKINQDMDTHNMLCIASIEVKAN